MYNDKPYNRVDHDSLPYCLFRSFFTDSAERWLPLLTELTEAVETLRVYCTATREVPPRIVLVQKFDNLRNHFLFRNWCSRRRFMNFLQRYCIMKSFSRIYTVLEVTRFFICTFLWSIWIGRWNFSLIERLWFFPYKRAKNVFTDKVSDNTDKNLISYSIYVLS